MPNDRGEHLKPPTNTPPERGLRTFSAARRQLGRALAGPLTALGDRLRGAPASDASKAAARSKYRLQQVLSTDRARSVEQPRPAQIAPPASAGPASPPATVKRASLPAGIAGSRIESDPKDPWLALAGSTLGSAAPPARASTLDEDLAALASEVVSATIPRPPETAPRNGVSRSIPPPLPLKASSAPNGTAKPLPPPPPLRTSPTAPTTVAQAAPAAPAPRVDETPTPEPLRTPGVRSPASPEAPAEEPSRARSSKVALSAAEPAEDAPAEEPIRTRSMARLLASQGHHKRALWIYDWLLATNATDDTLRSEAEALRATAGA